MLCLPSHAVLAQSCCACPVMLAPSCCACPDMLCLPIHAVLAQSCCACPVMLCLPSHAVLAHSCCACPVMLCLPIQHAWICSNFPPCGRKAPSPSRLPKHLRPQMPSSELRLLRADSTSKCARHAKPSRFPLQKLSMHSRQLMQDHIRLLPR